MTRTEIEAKFYLSDLAAFRAHLAALPVAPLSDRCFERNLRFDTPDRRLSAAGQVLRLRQDQRVSLTYKQRTPSPSTRVELEFEVSDIETASQLLQALGYQVVMMYEKYRQRLSYREVEIMLDELPFGNFVEVEAPSLAALSSACAELGLAWNRRVEDSYMEIHAALGSGRRDARFDDPAPGDAASLGYLSGYPAA